MPTVNQAYGALERIRQAPIRHEDFTVAGFFVDEATLAEIEAAVREGLGSLGAYRINFGTTKWDGEICLERIAQGSRAHIKSS